MKFKFLIASALLISVFAACKKDDDKDSKAPVVTISSPTEGESISGEVHIEFSVTDKSLHELLVTVTDDATGDTLYMPAEDPEVHDLTSYDFHDHFTPTVAAETNVTLNVLAEDHSDHATTKTLKFKVKP
jgi:hypothetical protein